MWGAFIAALKLNAQKLEKTNDISTLYDVDINSGLVG